MPHFFRPVAAIKFKMSEYFFQEILKCLSLNIQYVFSVLLWLKCGFVRSPNHPVFVYMLHSIRTFWNWSRVVFGHESHGEASAQRSLCNMCGADMKHSSNQNLSVSEYCWLQWKKCTQTDCILLTISFCHETRMMVVMMLNEQCSDSSYITCSCQKVHKYGENTDSFILKKD